jgi:cytidylate kinase
MSTSEKTVIAIDGPSASGKSTVAKAVAEALQIRYVDTGAMYRTIAWKCLEEKVDPNDAQSIVTLLNRLTIKVEFQDGRSKMLVDGADPGDRIRSEEVSAVVSSVSAVPEVRMRLVAEQRRLLEAGDLVMEGRDIGTVVFPDTSFKFFIDASPEVRAQRRAAELKTSRDQIAKTLARRDRQDTTRAASPLKVADDAVRIDSSDKSIAAVVDLILKQIRTRHFSRSS